MLDQTTAGFWLSPQQKTLSLAQQDTVVLPAISLVSLQGPVDPDRLRYAAKALTARHEVLRTTYQRVPGLKVPF